MRDWKKPKFTESDDADEIVAASLPSDNTVTLIGAHKHAGVNYKAGDTIAVNPAERAFLRAHKLIAGA